MNHFSGVWNAFGTKKMKIGTLQQPLVIMAMGDKVVKAVKR